MKKYLKAAISYEKEIRIETYPFPRDGIREAVFNVLIHCNWADSIPIQIRIEDEAMYISYCCILPSDWTTKTLMERHKSRPYNPDIANTFFRAGYVETWGQVFRRYVRLAKSMAYLSRNIQYLVEILQQNLQHLKAQK